MAGHLRFVALLFGVLAGSVLGQALPDPTRPPPGFAGEAATGAAVDTGPRLQSVLVPAKGRPTAVISGQTVRLGDMWGESRLIHVGENDVLLEGPQGRQRLLLTPEAHKEVVKEKSAQSPKGRKRDTP